MKYWIFRIHIYLRDPKLFLDIEIVNVWSTTSNCRKITEVCPWIYRGYIYIYISICTSVPTVCSETMLSHSFCHVKVHFDKNPNNHCQLYYLTKGRLCISPAKNFSVKLISRREICNAMVVQSRSIYTIHFYLISKHI